MSLSINPAFLAVLFFAPVLSLSAGERIAVMPFAAGKKITSSEAEYITERVRIALIKTEKFDVVSNDQLATMLKTVEERQKLGVCNSDECFIEVGKALQCDYMMVGKIENAFGEYTVSGKILDVQDQKYLKADEVTIKEKDAIPESSRILVDHLTDTLRYQEIKPVMPPQNTGKNDRWYRKKDYGTMVGLTLLAPGFGHLYAEQWRGAFYGTVWIGSVLGVAFGHFFYTTNMNAYEDAVAAFDDFYNRAQSWKKVRGYSSYIMLATYVVALLDILLTGDEYEKIYAKLSRKPEINTVELRFVTPNIDFTHDNRRVVADASGIAVVRHF